MEDEEAEGFYEAEADYEEEEEDLDDEVEEEEEEEAEVENEAEIAVDDQPAVPEIEEEVIPLRESDENHRYIKVRPRSEYRSSNCLQPFEWTEAIGIRAQQISNGAPVFTDVKGYTSPIDQAKKEMLDRRNPLILIREMISTPTYAEVEEWVVRDMAFPITDREFLSLTDREIAKLPKG